MNDTLELVKSNTILFTIELSKKSLSEWLIDDLIDLNKEFENNPILRIELNTNQEIKQLKDFLKREVKHLDEELYDSCVEELSEIKEDLKWRKSEDGKLVLRLEDWVQSTRRKVEDAGWTKLFVGRSIIDPKQLNIGGFVKDENELNKIKAEIEEMTPPVSPNFYLEIK
ncbi:hypothetical protein [Rufibacter psychrotolerans]|uniref:hypothetical protein n=1 Tax=Rufibacter psychrotolerans TaxID=2812556 RepID=UPI001967EBDC|nr:hypothetical protein [Rufibacter sp. SYSU D00308]